MKVFNLPVRPYGKLTQTCRIIEGLLQVRESVLYGTRSPIDWLPILSERLPQYEMKTHPLGVLITRKESTDVG